MNRNKLRALVATGAAAAVLGIAGFAFAAFTYTPTAEANGAAENFDPVTITVAADTATLLPGGKANVTLNLNNPNTNLKAEVLTISPAGVEVDQSTLNANTPAAKAYCEGKVLQHVNAAAVDGIAPIGAGTTPFTLVDGVEFDPTMDITCEGMSYKTKWTVQFQAVRV